MVVYDWIKIWVEKDWFCPYQKYGMIYPALLQIWDLLSHCWCSNFSWIVNRYAVVLFAPGYFGIRPILVYFLLLSIDSGFCCPSASICLLICPGYKALLQFPCLSIKYRLSSVGCLSLSYHSGCGVVPGDSPGSNFWSVTHTHTRLCITWYQERVKSILGQVLLGKE